MGLGGEKMTSYQELYAGRQVCCNCEYYCQHYCLLNGTFQAINCGHCIFPRIKARCPDQTCEHWKEIEKEPVSLS